LQTEDGHVLPELDKFAIVGHSAGGQTAANMAAMAKASALTPCHYGGRTWYFLASELPLKYKQKREVKI
jgi:pimeloyl-ACP methyl ester carboxylesterase